MEVIGIIVVFFIIIKLLQKLEESDEFPVSQRELYMKDIDRILKKERKDGRIDG